MWEEEEEEEGEGEDYDGEERRESKRRERRDARGRCSTRAPTRGSHTPVLIPGLIH